MGLGGRYQTTSVLLMLHAVQQPNLCMRHAKSHHFSPFLCSLFVMPSVCYSITVRWITFSTFKLFSVSSLSLVLLLSLLSLLFIIGSSMSTSNSDKFGVSIVHSVKFSYNIIRVFAWWNRPYVFSTFREGKYCFSGLKCHFYYTLKRIVWQIPYWIRYDVSTKRKTV